MAKQVIDFDWEGVTEIEALLDRMQRLFPAKFDELLEGFAKKTSKTAKRFAPKVSKRKAKAPELSGILAKSIRRRRNRRSKETEHVIAPNTKRAPFAIQAEFDRYQPSLPPPRGRLFMQRTFDKIQEEIETDTEKLFNELFRSL